MIGYPFDSHVTYDASGTPSFDRAVSSVPYRKLLKTLFTTGVLPDKSTNLQVVAKENMTVTVKAGFAMVNGCMKYSEVAEDLVLETSESLPRIDTIVMRLNDNDAVRACELAVIKGTSATNPTAPELTRTSNVYDIGLANIRINANSTEITNSVITDTRYDSERCGVISSLSEFDTTTIYQQVQADLEDFQTINELEFALWVQSLKDILDEETAGHLQLEIDELDGRITSISLALDGKANASHTHSASTITAGEFGGDVTVPANSSSSALLRNIVVLDSDIGEGTSVDYADGTIIFCKG